MIRLPLCWVLALLLVPVLIVAGPARPAAAATTVGPAVDYSMDWNTSSVPEGFWMDCTMRAQWTWDGFMQGVRTSGKCSLGFASGSHEWDIRAWYRGYSVVNGQRTATACSMRNVPTDETTLTDSWSLTATQGNLAGYEDELITRNDPVVERCDVDQVCFEAREDIRFYGDNVFEECQSVSIGYPPPVPIPDARTCAYGKVNYPQWAAPEFAFTSAGNSYSNAARVLRFQIDAGPQPAPGQWHVYAIVGRATPSPTFYPPVEPIGGSQQPAVLHKYAGYVRWLNFSGVTPTTIDLTIPLGSQRSPGTPLADLPRDYKIVGVGAFYGPLANGSYYYDQGGAWGAPDRGMIGKTDPALCSFYFGDKYYENTTTTDEPSGPAPINGSSQQPGDPDTGLPANEPDPQEDQGCGFSITDPSSWASAGICALVGLFKLVLKTLGSILQAIIGIPGAILDGLTGIFKALFIPSDGFFDDQVGDVKDAWSETAPVEIVDTFAGVDDGLSTASLGSGCAGPLLSVDLPLTSSPVDLRPFSSCAEWSGNLARITRTVLTIGAYLAALLLCIRILAASIGLQFSFSSGGDD